MRGEDPVDVAGSAGAPATGGTPPEPGRPHEPGAVDGPPVTGDAAVDAALGELARLADLDLDRHPAVVDAVQAALADGLAESD